MNMTKKDEESIMEWFGFGLNFNVEARILLEYSRILESFLQETSSTRESGTYIGDIRSNVKIDELYNDKLFRKPMIFAKLCEQLKGINLIPNPDIARNARYSIEVAHIIDPGPKFEELRYEAVSIVMQFISKSTASLDKTG